MNNLSIKLFKPVYLAFFLFLQQPAVAFNCCGYFKRVAPVVPVETVMAQPVFVDPVVVAPIEAEELATPFTLAQIVVSIEDMLPIPGSPQRYLNRFVIVSTRTDQSEISITPLHISRLDMPRPSVFFGRICDIIE